MFVKWAVIEKIIACYIWELISFGTLSYNTCHVIGEAVDNWTTDKPVYIISFLLWHQITERFFLDKSESKTISETVKITWTVIWHNLIVVSQRNCLHILWFAFSLKSNNKHFGEMSRGRQSFLEMWTLVAQKTTRLPPHLELMQDVCKIIDDADSGGLCGVMVEAYDGAPLFTRQPMQESYEGPPFPGERPHTMKIIQLKKLLHFSFLRFTQHYSILSAPLAARYQSKGVWPGKYRFIFVQT